MTQDLRFALRTLRRSPGFTIVAILTLALGIGANTAIFSVVNGVVLQPLAYEDPDGLYMIWQDRQARGGPPDEWAGRSLFSDWREHSRTFRGMAAVTGAPFTLTGTDRAVALEGARVSPGYFRILGVRIAEGRGFLDEEEMPGRANVVVLSYALWQERFGGEPGVVGRTIPLDGEPYAVVGVAPAGFRPPINSARELWVPLDIDPAEPDWGNVYLRVFGRLRAGVTEEEAAQDMDRVMATIAETHPANYGEVGTTLEPLRQYVVGPQTPLVILLAAVALVLLIACVNVANLMLARTARRERELAVRSAIGAGRGRLVQQVLTESLVVSALGGVFGLAFGIWGMGALRSAAPPGTPRIEEVALAPEIFVFALTATVLTGLAFGLLPALRAGKSDAVDALREGGRGGLEGAGPGSLSSALVVAEVALGLMLLVGAGLLMRSLASLRAIDPGYRTEGVLSAAVILTDEGYPEPEQVGAFFRELERRLEARSEVASAGATMVLPLGNTDIDLSFVLEGTSPEPGREPVAEFTRVTPGYFETLGMPLARGRQIRAQDADGAPLVAMVNREFVRLHMDGRDPIGQRLHFGTVGDSSPTLRTIVGIVENVRQEGLTEDPQAEVYVPHAQSPGPAMYVVARAADGRPASSLAPVVRDVLASLDREVPLTDVLGMEDRVRRDLATPRFVTLLLSAFAALALLLAAVGLYGVLAYSVSRRTREFGIRIAMGAEAGDVLGAVMRRGLVLVALGLALGLIGAFGVTRFLASLLYGVNPTDPLTLAGVSLLLLAVGVAACWLPARRATRVDPMVAVRAE